MRPQPPFQRWSIPRHLAAAIVALAVLGASAWYIAMYARLSAAGDQADLKRAQAQLTSIEHSRRHPTAAQTDMPLLLSARPDDMVGNAGRFALAHGVQISSLAVHRQAPSARELRQVRIAITAQSAYGAFKAWLADLQERYPMVGVQTLSMRALQNDARQEIQLELILYAKD